ncbi:aldehyde dehydrogenase family protein [Stappia sp.]|uniref:aldehyde dehydrogenase family protein n=1 Tax=Stappia sp. TaxID=1870903 RepID=UPI0032D8F2D0
MQISSIPATAADWHRLADGYSYETRMFIDGALCDAAEGGRYESVNPATGRVIAAMSAGTQVDVDRAVAAARRAFRAGVWSRLAPRGRMDVLLRFADLIAAHAADFALLDSVEMGKTVSGMLGFDIPSAVANIRFAAEAIDKVEGAVTATARSALHYTLRQPLGVVGLIVPWNYPMLMASWKLGPALAMGNSVVLKPAQQSGMSAVLLARLFAEAGGPAGVFNVVNGSGARAGQALARHMDVDKIGFTGSVPVGGLMMRYAGESNLKHVTTECGGKSPQVILADCDLDRAVDNAVHGIYSNQGEVCAAGSRIMVERAIHEEFLQRFIDRTAALYRPGDPLDPACGMGPLVDDRQHRTVCGYIARGLEEGARLAMGGGAPEGLEEGFYVAPTLFTEAHNDMTIAQEEIFGPVGVVMPIDDMEQGLELANSSIFGLGASVWTGDLARAHRFARDVESGMVWVNTFFDQDPTAPWGGVKQSGNGRDKCREALNQYSQIKSVWVHLGD